MAVQLTKVKFAINAIPCPKHRFRDVLYSMADALKVKKTLYPRNSSINANFGELIGFCLPF
jgi:hypothetical protein